MKIRMPILFILFLSSGSFIAGQDILEKLEEVATIDHKLMMPIRDGVRLCTDIFRPKTNEPVPVIFSKTPYNFNIYQEGEFVSRHRLWSGSGESRFFLRTRQLISGWGSANAFHSLVVWKRR